MSTIHRSNVGNNNEVLEAKRKLKEEMNYLRNQVDKFDDLIDAIDKPEASQVEKVARRRFCPNCAVI